jgi:hypothetical protein
MLVNEQNWVRNRGQSTAACDYMIYIGEDLIGRPLIAGIKLRDSPTGSDKSGGQCMGNGVRGAMGNANVKELRHLEQFGSGGNREIPVGERSL